ncbi:CPBP family intramembrane metalloprotease [Reticulibacter mediterranei]|uniref:CPBP family intramembrane metalloprotease n=1 Tax=Reticulibacter mediterranei TaxID=2778369 RepID=A0A8J3J0R4_9CHLR|nr:CPBP family glutamic-type intramembrane protease [Reticulibacter mediterranei]GHO99481.1 CPBP family intramembrane metalloprotease [Reticulibacter mediterranei]
MKTSTASQRSPLVFFVLVFALSLCIELLMWFAGSLTARLFAGLPLPIPAGFNLVTVLLAGYTPLIAACLLVARKEPPGGIHRLLTRAFDLKRIKSILWYVPIIFLNPLIYGLTYEFMLLLGRPLSQPSIAWGTLPLVMVVLFVEAVGEEVGWTAYVTDPLQQRWGSLQAGLILGAVTGLWHVIPGLLFHQPLNYIIWQGLCDVPWRILGVWLYNNSGKSVFALILFHVMYNLSWLVFPINGSQYDPAIAFPIMVVLALLVTILWGAKSLATFRFARPGVPMKGTSRRENNRDYLS